MKKYFSILFFFFVVPSYVYSSYLFINSNPINSTVYILEESEDTLSQQTNRKKKNLKKRKIGTTPMKITNFSTTVRIIIEQKGYIASTNTIKTSKKIQSQEITLTPLSFAIQFPQTGGEFFVDKTPYTSLDGVLNLPYGNYYMDFNKKTGSLVVNYNNSYTPYVAFFSSVTILSTILAITGAILGNHYYNKFRNATSPEDAVSALGNTSAWDSVMWSSVGIGTGSLIGVGISAGLYQKEKKRIQRFNGLNKSTLVMDCLSDFQEIILLGSQNPSRTLVKINQFLNKYEDKNSRFIPDVYLKRAGMYILNNQLKLAIADLQKVIKEYPTLYVYEAANKLLGDVFFQQQNYLKAYEYYSESIKIAKIFPHDELQMMILQSLFFQAKKNKKYENQFLDAVKNSKGLSEKQQEEIQKNIQLLS